MKINQHVLFQYLEKTNPTQLKGLIALRIDNPQAFQKKAEILFKELTLDKGTSFNGCNLLDDENFVKEMSELDEETYRFGGAFP